jgi:hypothetical protein
MDSSTGVASLRHKDDRNMLRQLTGRRRGGNLHSSLKRRVLLQGGTARNKRMGLGGRMEALLNRMSIIQGQAIYRALCGAGFLTSVLLLQRPRARNFCLSL